MKPVCGVNLRQGIATVTSSRFSSVCFKGCEWKFLTLLLVSLFIYYFVIFNSVESASNIPNSETIETQKYTSNATDSLQSWMPDCQDSFAFIHSDSGSNMADGNASFLMIFPHSTKQENISQELNRSLWKLSHFLGLMKDFHGATCLQQPLTHNSDSDHMRKHAGVKPVGNIFLDSSWCRFITKNWSVNIRNTGSVQNVTLLPVETNSMADQDTIILQICNILQGPFVIRKDVFHRIGGLLDGFGKLTLLEFFLRSKGELKMAKLTNCVWTPEITRTDRGTLEGSNEVPEYASFANKHSILRIVTESRIEWTACVANWKLCPEKPYVMPRDLPRVAGPICCSAVLGKMLTDFKWALNTLGLEYRVVYGTLLGAVRSQAIIPWTYDIDFALPISTFENTSTFSALQNLLGNQYYVGESFDMPRAHMLLAPYIEINTAPFFDGPNDLEGKALFSDELEEAVKGMLPVSHDWRERCYVDFYKAPTLWIEGSSLVTINNEQFLTLKQVDNELTNWYGKNYLQPALKGNWSGFTSSNHSPKPRKDLALQLCLISPLVLAELKSMLQWIPS